MASQIPQWIQDLNTVLGIVGFFITVIVMLQVRAIRKTFCAKARLPKVIADLSKAGSAFAKNLENWPANKNNGGAELKGSRVVDRQRNPPGTARIAALAFNVSQEIVERCARLFQRAL